MKALGKIAKWFVNYLARFPEQKASFIEIVIAGAICLIISFYAYQETTATEKEMVSCQSCLVDDFKKQNKTKQERINELMKKINEVQK